ncbi:MAG: protein-export chaperone SecB [Pseudomonadota bacterium]|nr:protein-export chaperone SecB [Pseudomonadota bacterium]
MTDQQPQAQLALERIYAKDISFEVPAAKVFMAEWQPELDINLSSNAEQLDPTHFQVVLSVTVNAKNQGAVAFIAEVHQAGVFLIENVSQEQLPHLLGAYCPNILFPFAREAINDIVTKGSFPQLLLAPINFDAAFAESQQRQQQQQAAEATGNA